MSIMSIMDNFSVPCPKPEMVQPRTCYQSTELPSFSSLFSDFGTNTSITTSSGLSSSSGPNSSPHLSPSLPHRQRKPKVPRNRINTQQFAYLKHIFNITAFPSTQLRKELSHQLNMSPRSIQIWFQNRRQSLKGHFPSDHRYHGQFTSHAL